MNLALMVEQVPNFMLIFIRISAFMAFVPFFNNQGFVLSTKVVFAFTLSMILFPTINYADWHIPGNIPGFILVVSQEIFVGILIGTTLLILLFAVQLIGRLLGFQMAFSMANAVDTTFGSNDNILGVILVMVATMLLLTLRGDHYLLYAVSKSFEILTPGSIGVTRPLLDGLSEMIVKGFEMGFKIASPAIVLLLCIDLTLGLIGKTASKMQIFFVGLPLKISVGLFGFTLMLGFVLSIWGEEIEKLPRYLFHFFRLMRI